MRYVVKEGDTLMGISAKHLGNAYRWGEIYNRSKDTIGRNPDHIEPGQVLDVPFDVMSQIKRVLNWKILKV